MAMARWAYWALGLWVVAMIILGFGLLVSPLVLKNPDDKAYWDRSRKLDVFREVRRVSVDVYLHVRQTGLPAESGRDTWAKGLSDRLASGDVTYPVVSHGPQPSAEGCYALVMETRWKQKPSWLTLTVLIKGEDRDSFTIVVAATPRPDTRKIPTVMVQLQGPRGGGSVGGYVATESFSKQSEPDLLGAFAERSIEREPLERFFQRFDERE